MNGANGITKSWVCTDQDVHKFSMASSTCTPLRCFSPSSPPGHSLRPEVSGHATGLRCRRRKGLAQGDDQRPLVLGGGHVGCRLGGPCLQLPGGRVWFDGGREMVGLLVMNGGEFTRIWGLTYK